mmetsp:Transcript_84218/g.265874  ORF Transcript_84218/g.265874 Transcript_84218/m.265874 type:complete len:350 (-) Transcript_84218:1087-2136(-)
MSPEAGRCIPTCAGIFAMYPRTLPTTQTGSSLGGAAGGDCSQCVFKRAANAVNVLPEQLVRRWQTDQPFVQGLGVWAWLQPLRLEYLHHVQREEAWPDLYVRVVLHEAHSDLLARDALREQRRVDPPNTLVAFCLLLELHGLQTPPRCDGLDVPLVDRALPLHHGRQHLGRRTAHGRQHLGKAKVLANRVVLVHPPEAGAPAGRTGAPPLGAGDERGVVAENGAALADTDHLLRPHGDDGQRGQGTDRRLGAVLHALDCAVGLAGVLADPEPAVLAHGQDVVEVPRRDAVARRDHDANRIPVRLQRRADGLLAEPVRLHLAVDGNRPAARMHDGIRTGSAGEGGHQDVV